MVLNTPFAFSIIPNIIIAMGPEDDVDPLLPQPASLFKTCGLEINPS